MAKKAPTPTPAAAVAPAPAPKPHPLDWSQKLILPALSLLVAIGFGLYGVCSGREVERLKAEVKQHAEQEQCAKDEAQWLRVAASKSLLSNLKYQNAIRGQVNPTVAEVQAAFALFLAALPIQLDNMKRDEAATFGEEVKDLWDKAAKKAEEEKPLDWYARAHD